MILNGFKLQVLHLNTPVAQNGAAGVKKVTAACQKRAVLGAGCFSK